MNSTDSAVTWFEWLSPSSLSIEKGLGEVRGVVRGPPKDTRLGGDVSQVARLQGFEQFAGRFKAREGERHAERRSASSGDPLSGSLLLLRNEFR